MPSLKDLQQTDAIDSAYLDKAIVYLESEEDVQIIKERWFFDEGRYVEFKSVDAGSGGGCMQVVRQVAFDRGKGIVAFGIVDRDALLQCRYWDQWWEKDDAAFQANQPWGEYVKVLKRWEIENYLLTPMEVETVMADKALRAMRSRSTVIEELLDHAEDVKVLSAAAVYCHENGYSFPDGFAGDKRKQALQSVVAAHLSKLFTDYDPWQLNEYIDRIEAFAEGVADRGAERWERLNRLIDGKRMLRRLGLYGAVFSDRRGDLARHIRINDRIDPEIWAYLKVFKAAGKT